MLGSNCKFGYAIKFDNLLSWLYNSQVKSRNAIATDTEEEEENRDHFVGKFHELVRHQMVHIFLDAEK